jgi:hypothetical protein
MNLLSVLSRSYESVPTIGQGEASFSDIPQPFWGSGVSGRKGWRYSPKLVEGKFCELPLYGVLRSLPQKATIKQWQKSLI